jgi:hypothetical protein
MSNLSSYPLSGEFGFHTIDGAWNYRFQKGQARVLSIRHASVLSDRKTQALSFPANVNSKAIVLPAATSLAGRLQKIVVGSKATIMTALLGCANCGADSGTFFGQAA